MKKLLILGIIAVILGGAAAFIGFFNGGQEIKKIGAPISKNCDLNLQDCEVKFKDKFIKFSFYPRPLISMTPTSLKVSGLEITPRLNARIYGTNMDMGVIKADFTRHGDTEIAQIVLSSCVLSVMEYRMELFSGETPIGIFIDFDLRD